MFFWLGTMLLLPSVIGGLGLLRGKQWARVVMIIVSIEFLFGFPVLTPLGVYGLWVLLGGRSRASRIGVTMLSVAVAFLLVLGLRFWMWQRGIPMKGFGLFGALAIVAISFGLARLMGVRTKTAPIVHVPVPPAVCCAHLDRFEQAMRAAGIPFKGAQALCRINRQSLERKFAPLAPVVYNEYFEADRAPEDIAIAVLWCTQCRSRLDTLHPADCHTTTPWFPAAPRMLTLAAERPFASRATVTAIAASPDGSRAAIATRQEIAIWEQAIPVLNLPPHGEVRAIAWSPDQRLLVTGGSTMPMFVWDAANGSMVTSFGPGVRGIAFSPDGRFLLASGLMGKNAAEGSTLDVWEVASGRLVRRIAEVNDRTHHNLPYFTAVAFTPDGSLAIAGLDLYAIPPSLREKEQEQAPWWWGRGVRTWRVSDGQEIDLIRLTTQVRALSVSRDGSRLFTAGTRLGMWRLADGAMLWDKRNWVQNANAASPDGNLVARGTGYQVDNHGPYEDTAVELFDGATGEFLTMGLHHTTATAIAFTGSGASLIAGGEQGELRFWNWAPDYGA